ncbi:MAG: hypothetical protein ACP5QA_11680 [Phycisphaerae bacterium]
MTLLLGHHVYSLRPAHARGRGGSAPLDPVVACTLALGALYWRKHSGPMRLYADSEFAAFIHGLGLSWIYDAGIDTAVLDSMPNSIRQDTFWVAAKVFAYGAATLPAAFLDVDLIVWKRVPDWENFDVTFLHREFNGRADGRGYIFPQGYQRPVYPWDGEEFNLGFVVLNNDALRKEFIGESMRFMSGNPGSDPFNHACFAEQYLLAQCAKARSAKVNALLPGPPHDESFITHIWGDKQKLREEPVRAWALVNRYIARLKQDFPEYISSLNRLFTWASAAAEAAARQAQNNRRNAPELLRRTFRHAPNLPVTPKQVSAGLKRPAMARSDSAAKPGVAGRFAAQRSLRHLSNRRSRAAGFTCTTITRSY